MKKALLVVDMQEATVGTNHAPIFRYDSDLLNRVNSVIDKTDASLVIYIKHLTKKNLINMLAPVKCFEGTAAAEWVNGLKIVSPHCFRKYVGNAFSNAELTNFLKENACDTIELIGVDGGACVALTAISACENGFKVILNTSAIGTVFKSKRDRYFNKLKRLGAEFI